jgi:hypothetical protein
VIPETRRKELCISCQRLDLEALPVEKLCHRCWQLMAPDLVEESDSLL